jgi:exopolysaccharide production protein ExoQ
MLERVLAIALVFTFSGAHMVLIAGPRPESVGEQLEYDYMLRFAWIPLYVPLLALMLRHWRSILALARRTPVLVLLILACPASTLWSIAPDDTARRSFALLMTAGFGWYLAARFDHRALLKLLAWALTIAIATGLVVGLLFPEIGVMQVSHAGAWRGLFSHKNTFGYVAALDLLILMILSLTAAVHRFWPILGLQVALLALVLSQSLTALITALVAILSLLFVATLRAPGWLRMSAPLFFITIGLVCLGISSLFPDDVLEALGRDRTLTGRTWLWEEAWEFITGRPLLGYGYGAFWAPDSPPAIELQTVLHWPMSHAHNGYLDLWLQLGLLGLVLFVWSLIDAIIRLATILRTGDPCGVYWSSALLSTMVVVNMVEGELLRQNELSTVLYVATVAMVGRIPNARGSPSLQVLA